ncbi:MAG: GNAT family N-acetyltransferase [Cyanobacteriota bacterium]|nr:GNAT family N-acetyltransferase [Cyanobacteriota bacterium]
MELKVEAFDKTKHDRSCFCCEKDSLDNYIQKQASQDIKKRVSTVWVLISAPDPNILAYYTLSSYTVETQVLDEEFAKKLPRYPRLPATLLGRLAVDRRHQRKGLGEFLLVDALKRSLDATTQVASLAVVAEVLDEEVLRFYTKYGFQLFNRELTKLYLPMKSVAALF